MRNFFRIVVVCKKDVACDVNCEQYLTAEQKALWDEYQLEDEIAKLTKRLPEGATPRTFRVTFGKGRASLGVVFEIDVKIDLLGMILS